MCTAYVFFSQKECKDLEIYIQVSTRNDQILNFNKVS